MVSAEEQTVTKNIAGVPSNFEVAVQTNAETGAKSYVYQEKASATTWKAMNLSMEGAVSNLAVESDTTAPTVNVTWSYAKAADGAEAATDAVDYSTTPAGPSASTTTFSKTENAEGVDVVFNYGSATAITGIKYSTDQSEWKTYGSPDSYYTIDNANNKVTVKSAFISGLSATRYWRVYFDNSESTYVDLTFTAE